MAAHCRSPFTHCRNVFDRKTCSIHLNEAVSANYACDFYNQTSEHSSKEKHPPPSGPGTYPRALYSCNRNWRAHCQPAATQKWHLFLCQDPVRTAADVMPGQCQQSRTVTHTWGRQRCSSQGGFTLSSTWRGQQPTPASCSYNQRTHRDITTPGCTYHTLPCFIRRLSHEDSPCTYARHSVESPTQDLL